MKRNEIYVNGGGVQSVANRSESCAVKWAALSISYNTTHMRDLSRAGCLRRCLLLSGLLLNRQIELEFGWQLVFRIETIREVHTSYAAIGVYLHTQFIMTNVNNLHTSTFTHMYVHKYVHIYLHRERHACT